MLCNHDVSLTIINGSNASRLNDLQVGSKPQRKGRERNINRPDFAAAGSVATVGGSTERLSSSGPVSETYITVTSPTGRLKTTATPLFKPKALIQRKLSWRVQNFVVTGRTYFEQEHYKMPLNFEFDPNIVIEAVPGLNRGVYYWLLTYLILERRRVSRRRRVDQIDLLDVWPKVGKLEQEPTNDGETAITM